MTNRTGSSFPKGGHSATPPQKNKKKKKKTKRITNHKVKRHQNSDTKPGNRESQNTTTALK